MRVVAIVQARMGSNRLPNKVMRDICGLPMIDLLLARLSQAKTIDEIVVATSTNILDDPLAAHIEKIGYVCIRGSEYDVLERYIDASYIAKADVVVRVTGDCPIIDPLLVDTCVLRFLASEVDYLDNTKFPTFPDGLDVAVVRVNALYRAGREATSQYDREHVMPYIYNSDIFKLGLVSNDVDYSDLRWTVDEYSDFQVISNVFSYFWPDIHFPWQKVLELQKERPELFEANQKIERNEGALMNSGQKLWKRAKHVIPGGSMLLSKRSEMFLPNQWPSYFSRAKGCRIWDLDGNEFIDFSLMGVGTNILGYTHSEIDEAVLENIRMGNMSTLNCPEEVYLAERLIELHPWAQMVRFARSGGEANAIAIRIARAASGKDKVAMCGYHGWHDWYLAANLENDQILDGHLLPGLVPNGVPSALRDTVFPFFYNDFEGLCALIEAHDIGVIKMEVERNTPPRNDFLRKVRDLATRKNIVLIFDECTSGFRETFGGLHLKYDVEPDVAIFGKALGNGYAITAAIGRREVMEAAQSTFISSTFWTERIGPTAALKTLEVMEREKSWETITSIGEKISDAWKALAARYELDIEVTGLSSMPSFTFRSPDMLKYRTLITQEMLKRGVLATTSVYACIDHGQAVIDHYLSQLEPIFGLIKECETERSVDDLLDGPVCHAGFKRLN